MCVCVLSVFVVNYTNNSEKRFTRRGERITLRVGEYTGKHSLFFLFQVALLAESSLGTVRDVKRMVMSNVFRLISLKNNEFAIVCKYNFLN